MAIQISPEIKRLAQMKARSTGASLNQELARSIVEESVMELDPEIGLLIESDSWTEIEGLAKTADINDVVINSRHIDVRIIDSEGNIEINRALVGSAYLANGSLMVAMSGTDSGSVVGYVTSANWLTAEQEAKNGTVSLIATESAAFDLSATLQEVCNRAQAKQSGAVKTMPNEKELANFITSRDSLINARQKQIIGTIVNDQSVRALFEKVAREMRRSDVKQVISDSAIWSNRVEKVVDSVSPKFNALSKNDVAKTVRKTGELFGGQPNAPQFRKHLISTLTKEQLMKKFAIAKVADVVDQVFSGKSAVDSVRSLMTNSVAVDLASTIKQQRQRAEGFAAATAEEIGMAFKQLALQPSYATHSSGDQGVESINEALQLLEAAELAEQAKSLEQEWMQ